VHYIKPISLSLWVHIKLFVSCRILLPTSLLAYISKHSGESGLSRNISLPRECVNQSDLCRVCMQAVTAVVGRMSSCAVIHGAASLSAGSVISTVTARTAQTRQTVVRSSTLFPSIRRSPFPTASLSGHYTLRYTVSGHSCQWYRIVSEVERWSRGKQNTFSVPNPGHSRHVGTSYIRCCHLNVSSITVYVSEATTNSCWSELLYSKTKIS